MGKKSPILTTSCVFQYIHDISKKNTTQIDPWSAFCSWNVPKIAINSEMWRYLRMKGEAVRKGIVMVFVPKLAVVSAPFFLCDNRRTPPSPPLIALNYPADSFAPSPTVNSARTKLDWKQHVWSNSPNPSPPTPSTKHISWLDGD